MNSLKILKKIVVFYISKRGVEYSELLYFLRSVKPLSFKFVEALRDEAFVP